MQNLYLITSKIISWTYIPSLTRLCFQDWSQQEGIPCWSQGRPEECLYSIRSYRQTHHTHGKLECTKLHAELGNFWKLCSTYELARFSFYLKSSEALNIWRQILSARATLRAAWEIFINDGRSRPGVTVNQYQILDMRIVLEAAVLEHEIHCLFTFGLHLNHVLQGFGTNKQSNHLNLNFNNK